MNDVTECVDMCVSKEKQNIISDKETIKLIEEYIISEHKRIKNYIINKNNNLTKKKEESKDLESEPRSLEIFVDDQHFKAYGQYSINIQQNRIEVYTYILNTSYYCYFEFVENDKLTEIGKLHNELIDLLLFNSLPDNVKIEKMRSKKLSNIL